MLSWKLHGNGKQIQPGEVVSTDERLSWPRTFGMGIQHIAAMFGATFLVPIITGFSPTTTLFSQVSELCCSSLLRRINYRVTLVHLLHFLAPVAAAKTSGGIPAALGG